MRQTIGVAVGAVALLLPLGCTEKPSQHSRHQDGTLTVEKRTDLAPGPATPVPLGPPRSAQEEAIRQQSELAKAQRLLNEKQRELAAAQRNVERERQEAQQAQRQVQRETEQAGLGVAGTSTAVGTVLAVGDGELVLDRQGEPALRLTVTPDTPVIGGSGRNGGSAVNGGSVESTARTSIQDLPAGTPVRVQYRLVANQPVADRIEIFDQR